MRMLPFISNPSRVLKSNGFCISDFSNNDENNLDQTTVYSFGNEWNKFNSFSEEDINTAGKQYFDLVKEEMVGKDKIALDLGCGSGRWSKYISSRIGFIEAIDPSDSVYAAAGLLKECSNIRISKASSSNIPFADESFDFILSLGVLHHIPDTLKAMQDAAKKLKKNGYFLIYLYYDLDNRGFFFRFIFNLSTHLRKQISKLSPSWKNFTCDLIAVLVYLPLVLLSKFVSIFAKEQYKKLPLSYYVDKSFQIIRNDALDRFGTPLEQRFTREKIKEMMQKSGLSNIIFSEQAPYWHAIGTKA